MAQPLIITRRPQQARLAVITAGTLLCGKLRYFAHVSRNHKALRDLALRNALTVNLKMVFTHVAFLVFLFEV